jgi:hypothetical protein
MISINGEETHIQGSGKELLKEWAIVTIVLMQKFDEIDVMRVNDISSVFKAGVKLLQEDEQDAKKEG